MDSRLDLQQILFCIHEQIVWRLVQWLASTGFRIDSDLCAELTVFKITFANLNPNRQYSSIQRTHTRINSVSVYISNID